MCDDHKSAYFTAPHFRPLSYSLLEKKSRAFNTSKILTSLVHNHPSGDPTPSQADIQMTKAIVDIAAPLGISVHDHIIVGKNGHASMPA